MKPIPSCPNYYASDDGQIWRDGKQLRSRQHNNGYRQVTLSLDGKKITHYVHRLVCEAYHGPAPEGHECRHVDGTRANNVPENLAWSTKAENEADKLKHGTLLRGEDRVWAILKTVDYDPGHAPCISFKAIWDALPVCIVLAAPPPALPDKTA